MRIVFIGDNPNIDEPIMEITEDEDIQGILDGTKLTGLNMIITDIHSKANCRRLISEIELLEHCFSK